jgi:hypothetical protein
MKFCHPQWEEEKRYLDSELKQLKDHPPYFNDYWYLLSFFICVLLEVKRFMLVDVIPV